MKRPIRCHRERCLGYGRREECYTGPQLCRVRREFMHYYTDADLEKWQEIIFMEIDDKSIDHKLFE